MYNRRVSWRNVGFMPPVLPDNQKVYADPFMSVKVTADNIKNVVNHLGNDFNQLGTDLHVFK